MAINGPKPSMYLGLREQALRIRLQQSGENPVYAVLMDWFVGRGTATIAAFADGTASVYLNSGGGFLGGAQRYPPLRETAIRAVQVAASLFSLFQPTKNTDLPAPGEVLFYLTTKTGISVARAKEEELRAGTDQLAALGNVMQMIITLYRTNTPTQPNRNPQ
jgi:hypothetical protein